MRKHQHYWSLENTLKNIARKPIGENKRKC